MKLFASITPNLVVLDDCSLISQLNQIKKIESIKKSINYQNYLSTSVISSNQFNKTNARMLTKYLLLSIVICLLVETTTWVRQDDSSRQILSSFL